MMKFANRTAEVPAIQIPGFRYAFAMEAGVKQVMMTAAGGLGDHVCAVPAMTHAFRLFADYEISLISSFPEIFDHLPFKNSYHSRSPAVSKLIEEEWLTLHTYSKRQNMSDDFIAHHFTQAVDYCSLLAFQRQLPVNERNIVLMGSDFSESNRSIKIVVHPGRQNNFASKTFPKSWWDPVIKGLGERYPFQVAVVGKDVSSETGTVDVEIPANVIDMRNQLSLKNLVSVLKAVRVVVTNDSAPLHIAAAGQAVILFIASAKHPDLITHWRRPRGSDVNAWGWRMQNLGLSGLWDHLSSNPVRKEPLDLNHITPGIMDKILPHPEVVVNRVRMLI